MTEKDLACLLAAIIWANLAEVTTYTEAAEHAFGLMDAVSSVDALRNLKTERGDDGG